MQKVPFSLLISITTIPKVTRHEFQTNRTFSLNSLPKPVLEYSDGHPLFKKSHQSYKCQKSRKSKSSKFKQSSHKSQTVERNKKSKTLKKVEIYLDLHTSRHLEVKAFQPCTFCLYSHTQLFTHQHYLVGQMISWLLAQ